MKKHNCHDCKFKERISNNAHIKCNAEVSKKSVTITSTYAVINGWANHPNNFDPIWIDKCKKYEKIGN
jgi:hypothetical protein